MLETQISGDRVDDKCRHSGFDIWHHIEAQGHQGGIWLLWDSYEVDLNIIQTHEQFITAWIKGGNSESWLFTTVYTSPHQRIKERLWEEIKRFTSTVRHPWLLARDFNDTINVEEKDHRVLEMLQTLR